MQSELPVKRWRYEEALSGCYSHEELGAVGVLPTIGHGQQEGPVVFEKEVLICRGQRNNGPSLREHSRRREGGDFQGRAKGRTIFQSSNLVIASLTGPSVKAKLQRFRFLLYL